MGGGGNIEVGSVRFTIGIDLASFQRNLEQAQQIARSQAAQIQQTLARIAITQEQVVRRRARVVNAPTPPAPPNPPTATVTQEVRVQYRFLPAGTQQQALPGGALGVPTGGRPQFSPAEAASLLTFMRS